MAPAAKAGLRHVALLRGINVGGKNIIRMAALEQTFEGLGFTSVKTLLASGNVLFDAPKQDLRALEERIEAALSMAFDYDATVVVKSKPEMTAIVRAVRTAWPKPSAAQRYYIAFLRHTVDSKKILATFTPKDGIETLTYTRGALLWAADVRALTRSVVSRQFATKSVYAHVTMRNLNTTMKIAALVGEEAAR